MIDEATITEKFQLLAGQLDERAMRLWAATEARAFGWGGTSAVSRATGIARSTIDRGRAELERGERLDPGRVRRPGAGRKPLAEADRSLLRDLERLVDPGSCASTTRRWCGATSTPPAAVRSCGGCSPTA